MVPKYLQEIIVMIDGLPAFNFYTDLNMDSVEEVLRQMRLKEVEVTQEAVIEVIRTIGGYYAYTQEEIDNLNNVQPPGTNMRPELN